MLTLALPKGRLLDPVLSLVERVNLPLVQEARANPRRLVFEDRELRLVIVKDADVPAYVAQGVAEVGFVGLDQILEQGGDLLRLRRFGFGHCRLCLLGRGGWQLPPLSKPFRLATKYPKLAQRLLAARGLMAEVVPLAGSVELAATLGLAPYVLDLVETGTTVRENGLVIVETWLSVAPYFVANRGWWETARQEAKAFLYRLGGDDENSAGR